jgi:glycosyltransferase involved in cell wall biosynthesis
VEQSTFAWNLISLLRREAIDILHVQDPLVALYVQRARRLGLVRTRTILAHGTEEPLDFQRRMTFLQHLAPWHLEEARAAGVWKPTWAAIPNFVDTELFKGSGFRVQGSGGGDYESERGRMRQELGIPQDAVVVLCAAAIKRGHKRVDYVLREFAALCQSLGQSLGQGRPQAPLYLVVAGGWERETDELIAEGRELLGDRVRFLVRFPRDRMPQLYRAADVFTLGSLKEMMPIALLEATASGLPCLVNAHPVMQWMIGPGGVAIDMSRAGALAAALEPLVLQPELRGELSRLARQHCVLHFSEGAVVDQILAYYQQVMALGKQPQRAELAVP